MLMIKKQNEIASLISHKHKEQIIYLFISLIKTI
jgi:hypothetical protein